MTVEENIISELSAKFNYLSGKIKIQRPRRIFLEVGLDNFLEVFDYISKRSGFSHLCTITGLDEGQNLGFIYHLAKDPGLLINLKTSVPKENPVLKSVTGYFPGAEIYERELVDLFGAKVEGLPQGHHYPLIDDWPQGEFPLRKDWKLAEHKKGKEPGHA